jgi:hypothetical protein
VGCRSAVHDLGVGPMDRHLVEGSDQTRLIPGPVRRRGRKLRRRKGGVGLVRRRKRWSRR